MNAELPTPLRWGLLAAAALLLSLIAGQARGAEAVAEPAPAEPAPAPEAPPAALGAIVGVVRSAADGQPLIEARVQVEGAPHATLTDLDGAFRLELPPGRWDLRLFAELHQPQRVQRVVVEAGREARVDVVLRADDGAVLEVKVEAEPDKARAAVRLEQRRRAAVVSDGLSGEEIARTPDGSAADALKRVVGATVTEGRYVVVRGLSGRYVMTLLEGVVVPSPEPDEPGLPLDLFPTALLSGVSVVKSANADLPGSFAGGALLVDARQFPDRPTFGLRLSLQGDTVSTLREAPTAAGGAWDSLGFDDGGRALPEGLPRDRPLVEGDGLDAAAIEAAGESMSADFSSTRGALAPGVGFAASGGATSELFGRRLGWLGSLSFGRTLQRRRTEVTTFRVEDREAGTLAEREAFVEESGSETARLGALVSTALELSHGHELSFVGLATHAGEARVQVTRGVTDAEATEVESTRLSFVERSVLFGQLRGRHRLADAAGLELSWQGHGALAARDEPNTRDLAVTIEPDGGHRFINEPGSGEHLFGALSDRTVGAGFDARLPLSFGKPKLGAALSRSDRTFEVRRFRWQFPASRASDPASLRRDPGELFVPETIGPDFVLTEKTAQTDGYEATQLLLAGYGLVDVTAFDPLRIVGGVRVERLRTDLSPGSRYAVEATVPDGVERVDLDVLPSANVVWSPVAAQNVRLSWARTVARPQLRELAPFLYTDFTRRRTLSGNPELLRTSIQNADLRWELFPGESEVVAAGVFGKWMEAPIELVIQNENGDLSFENAARAELYGAELEARTSLGRLHEALHEVGIGVNLTLVTSTVTATDEQAEELARRERPLQGQSPWVVNAAVRWAREAWGTDAQLLYNVFGPRVAEVAKAPFPDDVYEAPVHRLDVAVAQRLPHGFEAKVAVTNLLDSATVETLADAETSRFRPGVGAQLTLGWRMD